MPAVDTPTRAASRSRSANETRYAKVTLAPTKNDLPPEIRSAAIGLLNQRLADAIDLRLQCKQAHWNVKGPAFISLHRLFDEIDQEVGAYVDVVAERIVQLGGVAEGTVGVVAERTTLVDYPIGLRQGAEHAAALSDALAMFGSSLRTGIGEMEDLKDPVSADVLTEISRGVDKWLWFVEAHLGA